MNFFSSNVTFEVADQYCFLFEKPDYRTPDDGDVQNPVPDDFNTV